MSDGPLSPEEVAHRGFGTSFRGFDTGEVRAYLQRVANELRASTTRERDLHRRLADAEHRAAHPVVEGDALTRALGDEMGRILASAQQAANGLKEKAEENAARILREAHDQAQRIRAQAEAILAVRSEEADAEAADIRRAAEVEAAGVVERADREATAATAEIEVKARQLVQDAQAARARVLGDLTRRRRLLQTQVEQLRAGRERLLEAYRVVRRTTDHVADELQRVEDEAREAAGAAAERMAAEPGEEEIDDVLPVVAGDAVGAVEAEPGDEAGAPGGPGQEGAGLLAVTPEGEAPSKGGGGGAEPRVRPESAAADASALQRGQTPAGDDAGSPSLSQAIEAAGGVGASGGDDPEVEPALRIVSTRPGDAERRSLRLLRRSRSDPSPGGTTAPAGEGVRPVPLGAAAAQAAHATPPSAGHVGGHAVPGDPPSGGVFEVPPSGQAHGVPADADPTHPEEAVGGVSEADAAVEAVAGVDELFARIRAGRADAVAKAHEVLAADPATPAVAGQQPTVLSPVAADPPPAGSASARTGPAGPAEEETLLQRRDTAVEGLEAKLARKLKRALQDEQNEVLDRLRSARPGAGPDAVLPALEDQAQRYRAAAAEPLDASALAGVAFVAPPDKVPTKAPDVADVVADLATAVAEPLRRALERALRDGTDQGGVDGRIGAAYRECKAQRIEGLAGDAVTAAFCRGALSAMPAGAASRWVVDDDGRPCPDCDDNALAGPTPAGEAFPTGQTHPPAHAGCRCLLAPAELAAAVRTPPD